MLVSQTILVSLSLLMQLVTGAEKWPEPEDVAPCLLKHSSLWDKHEAVMYCEFVKLADVVTIFSKLDFGALMKVHLTNVTGGRLPSNLFSKVRVSEIDITDCQLEGVADDDDSPAFVGLERTLKYLTIENSIGGDNKLSNLNLGHLKKLVYLHLLKNNIPEIGNNWFQNGPVSLTDLNIQDCGVRNLGDNAFRPLIELKVLTLESNPIQSFAKTMFPSRKLIHLILVDVNLASVPSDLFSEMPALKSLYLENNSITHITEALFSPIWEQLYDLYLFDNPVVCDDHMNWLLKLRRPPLLMGVCETPSDQRGKTLTKFIIEKKNKIERRKQRD